MRATGLRSVCFFLLGIPWIDEHILLHILTIPWNQVIHFQGFCEKKCSWRAADVSWFINLNVSISLSTYWGWRHSWHHYNLVNWDMQMAWKIFQGFSFPTKKAILTWMMSKKHGSFPSLLASSSCCSRESKKGWKGEDHWPTKAPTPRNISKSFQAPFNEWDASELKKTKVNTWQANRCPPSTWIIYSTIDLKRMKTLPTTGPPATTTTTTTTRKRRRGWRSERNNTWNSYSQCILDLSLLGHTRTDFRIC